LQTFRTPLGLKYACPSQSTWHLAINSLMTVLSVGLPLARKNGMWIFRVAI